MESYKHRFAKETLAAWFAAAPHNVNPHCGYTRAVECEYPIAQYSDGEEWRLWGFNRHDWRSADWHGPPTYDEMVAERHYPLCIFDVALFRPDGALTAAIEVVHKHDIDAAKLQRFADIRRAAPRVLPRLYRVSAEWVLSQIGVPRRLNLEPVRCAA